MSVGSYIYLEPERRTGCVVGLCISIGGGGRVPHEQFAQLVESEGEWFRRIGVAAKSLANEAGAADCDVIAQEFQRRRWTVLPDWNGPVLTPQRGHIVGKLVQNRVIGHQTLGFS